MARTETPAERLARLSTETDATKAVQMKFRIPGVLHKQIEEASARNGRRTSEEIRIRLDASFTDEVQAGDEETYRLLQAIKTLVHNVDDPFGSWHQNRFAFDVFRAAVLALLDLLRPAGEPVQPIATDVIAYLFLGEEGSAETVARMLAGGAATAAGIPFPSHRLQRERK